MNTRKTVIFDWQGTLVDVSSIRHLVENTDKKNFPEFHRQTGNCPPIQETLEAVKRAAMDGKFVAVLTGCSENFEQVFFEWGAKHGVHWDMLLMRAAGDFRKDVVIKKEMLDFLRSHGHEIEHAWDDNPNIIQLWQDESIPVTVVPGWSAS